MKRFLQLGSTLALFGGLALAGGIPPQDAKPLSEVLKTVESKGVTPICEASFDDGVWEVEGYRGQQAVELHVHPQFLSILAEHPEDPQARPTAGALSAREVVARLEKAGFQRVLEIDWENGQWEAEAINAQGSRELKIEATTGKILSDRAD